MIITRDVRNHTRKDCYDTFETIVSGQGDVTVAIMIRRGKKLRRVTYCFDGRKGIVQVIHALKSALEIMEAR